MIANRAMLDVPHQRVTRLAGLLRAERSRRGTRRKSRALSRACGRVRIGRATAYHYRDEIVTVLSEQAPDLHEALQQVADDGWTRVILDGKVLRTDRCAQTTNSTKGTNLPALPDGGYEGAGQGVHPPVMRPAHGNVLAVDHLAYNALQRGLRARGERGFALLISPWRTLQRITARPCRIGDIVAAGMVFTDRTTRLNADLAEITSLPSLEASGQRADGVTSPRSRRDTDPPLVKPFSLPVRAHSSAARPLRVHRTTYSGWTFPQACQLSGRGSAYEPRQGTTG